MQFGNSGGMDQPKDSITAPETNATRIAERSGWRHGESRRLFVAAKYLAPEPRNLIPRFFEAEEKSYKRGPNHLPYQKTGAWIDVSKKFHYLYRASNTISGYTPSVKFRVVGL